MNPLRTWRLPLRLARRDALRHRARSVLVLVMIALPVMAVTAADVLHRTQTVSPVESLDRRLGSAAALVSVQQGIQHVEQGPDPDNGFGDNTGDPKAPLTSASTVQGLLGGARLLEVRDGDVEVSVPAGLASVNVSETDLSDPLAYGLFRLTSGRLPRAPHEVVINQALADQGLRIGDRLDVDHADSSGNAAVAAPTVVGIAESTTVRTYPVAAGPLGSFGVDSSSTRSWLVAGGPVSWATVRRLNDVGATVLSRAVIESPPPRSQIPPDVSRPSRDKSSIEVLALIGIMALIEVVLLAGPAFAVGARKQQRSLALMAATGGTPRQSRRVMVASALVLGSTASLGGALLGVGVARLVEPLLQSHADDYFGPFQVEGPELAGIAAFGLLSAFLAAVVPAWIASRQDIVAVLAGRRGDRRPSLRSPLVGLVLLGVGILGAVAGARGSGELLIAAAAIPSVLGMVLLIPIVLALVARVSGRLPLVLRYAVRDANRHRTRTVPAIAAVAATVAGVVALSIGLASDQKRNEATYAPQYSRGDAMVTSYSQTDWDAVGAVVTRDLPGATLRPETGLPDDLGAEYADTAVELPGSGHTALLDGAGGATGSSLMVSDGPLPFGLVGLTPAAARSATQALTEGTSVAFVGPGRRVGAGEIRVTRDLYPTDGDGDRPTSRSRAQVAAVFVPVPSSWSGPFAVLTPAAASQLHATPTTVALGVAGADISKAQETTVAEGVAAVSSGASFYVERGYQPANAYLIIRWILIGMGAVLMLGGTLTATFLALSDARPDLATLAAVGASPRIRRGVAGGYAVVVGVVGAVLGTGVGLIPGIAITYPLTGSSYVGMGQVPVGPFLAIPWLTFALLIVALPLATALVVAVAARSRLPLAARLD